jgi:cytochrome c peroxidase
MRKLISWAFLIAIVVISTYISVGYFTHNKAVPKYSDEKLRDFALSKGLRATPSSFEELLKLVDNNATNLITKEKIALGKELFFDTNLSKNRKTSCATCHSFSKDIKNDAAILSDFLQKDTQNINDCSACHLRDQSGVDRFTFSQGDGGSAHPHLLNTQTILNTGFAKYLTWSGEVKSIKEQSQNSFIALHKMNIEPKELEERLKADRKYLSLFGDEANITFENANKAIEIYVKTLVTRGSYDRFLEGDNDAISDQAKRGLANFIHFGCKGCHHGVSLGGQSIQKFPLRDFANVYELRLNQSIPEQLKRFESRFPFKNDGGFLGKSDNYLFRVPILRNVSKTSPYFHNGSVAKLREAVDIMARHQLGRHMSDEQIDEIAAFLRTLEGEIVDYGIEVER